MVIENNASRKIKYPSLNGLRALCILLVVMSHLQIRYNIFSVIYTNHLKYLYPFVAFISDGAMGVNMFFVISGFLITTLLSAEEQRNRSISLKHFYIRRILRIFPAYYFFLLVLFLLDRINLIEVSENSWLTAITYTKYFNWDLDWYTAHAWTLSVEEQFYLLYPLIFMMGGRIRKFTAVFITALVPVIKICLYFHYIPWMNEYTIFQRIDAITMGCLIALYQNEILNIIQSHLQKLFYASLAGLFLIGWLPNIFHQYNLELDLFIAALGTTYGLVANLFLGVILLYSVFGPQYFWFRALNTTLMNFIGKISYSIYLWQQLFISEVFIYGSSFPQNLIFLFLAAIISFYLIERPFLRLKEKFKTQQTDISGYRTSVVFKV